MALRWVDNLPKEKWTQAYDGGIRWGHMTSSLAEAMNSVFKDIRGEPITTLVKSTYYRCAKLFAKRATQAAAVVASGQEYTEAWQERIVDSLQKASNHIVINFDRRKYTFIVEETVDPHEGRPMDHFKVDLQAKWCNCGKFQALHLPCSHVIAACLHVNISYQSYIDDVYKAATVLAVYDDNFSVVQGKRYWPTYVGPVICPRADMKRTKKGRLNKTRIRTEMNDFKKRENLCGLCRIPSHNYNSCPNAGGPSA